MSDLTKDIPKGTLTKEETIAYLIEIDNRFCIEPCVMRNAIYSACHYLDEESAKEPQEYEPVKKIRHRGGFEIEHCPNCDKDYQKDNRYTIEDEYCGNCGKLLDSTFRSYCANCGGKVKVD